MAMMITAFCKGLTVDLVKEEDQDCLLSTISKEQGGKLHVLINNSGTNWAEPLTEYPLTAFDKVWSVNVKVRCGSSLLGIRMHAMDAKLLAPPLL